MHTICFFEAWEVRSPALQTVHNLDLKQKSYGRLKTNRAKPKQKFFDFAAAPPFRRVFPSCETTLWHTSATSQRPYAHFEATKWAGKIPSSAKFNPGCENALSLKNGLRNSHFVAKWFPNFQMAVKWSLSFKMATKWFPNFKMATKILQASKWAAKWFRSPIATPCEILHLLWKWPFDCEMIFQTSKWLWNDFQNSKWAAKMFFFFPFGFKMAKKWPPSYEMICENTLQSQGKLQKCQQSPAPCF